jgi:hypothetical protein
MIIRFRRKYKIVRSGFKIYPFRILQRHTILCFIHWWDTPEFGPPHLHQTRKSAYDYILEQDKHADIVKVD